MAEDHRHEILIGIGNPDRGDDGAGRVVAARLAGTLPGDVEIAEAEGEATALLARLSGKSAAILVDACVSGAPAGTVRRFDATDAPLPRDAFGVSTHGFGVADAIELARVLGELPRRCLVYAIEGESFDPGAPLSAPVAAAVEALVRQIQEEWVHEDMTRA